MVLAVLVAGGALGGVVLFRRPQLSPPPVFERCVATANGNSVTVTTEQSHYAALISGIAVRRGLPPRAATIALATAYQESGIRNLDYGDRDSLGLFQQRPSQGWGTVAEIMDPVYATNAFYDALIEVPGWQTGDINDTAQAVQRSGVPEGYRKHEGNARILASVLTGQSPGGLTCAVAHPGGGHPEATLASLQEALGPMGVQLGDADPGPVLTYRSDIDSLEWTVAHHAIANAADLGVRQVQVGDRVWTADSKTSEWSPADAPADGVVIRY